MTIRAAGFAAALLVWTAAHAAGQTPGREPILLEIPASTRAMALGNAFQLDSGDGDVLLYNPALLGRASGFAAAVHTFDGGGLAGAMAAATSWGGGGVGLAVQLLEYGRAPLGTAPGGQDPLLRDGPVGAGELSVAAGYARSLLGVEVGAAARLVDQRVAGGRDATVSVDLGVATDAGPLTVGLAIQHLGRGLETGGAERPLPTLVTLGAGGYGREVGPLDVGVAAAVSRRDDGEVLVGGGIEVGYWPVVGRTFVVRAGARSVPEGDLSPLTFGGSFWGDDVVVEYAFQPVDGGTGIHRVTLGWR